MAKYIVGVAGKAGAGKSTVALLISEHIKRHHNTCCNVYSFGSELKKLVARAYDVKIESLYTEIGKSSIVYPRDVCIIPEWLPVKLPQTSLSRINRKLSLISVEEHTAREILQIVGTLFRKEQPSYWISALSRHIHREQCFVIDDVRYENECEWIRGKGGLLCTVRSIEPVASYCEGDEEWKSHQSETELDGYSKWDKYIQNDKKIGGLEGISLVVRSWLT